MHWSPDRQTSGVLKSAQSTRDLVHGNVLSASDLLQTLPQLNFRQLVQILTTSGLGIDFYTKRKQGLEYDFAGSEACGIAVSA